MLERLMRHRAWASRLLFEWCGREMPSDPYGVKMVSHILLGEAAWLNRLCGEPVAADTWSGLTPELWAPQLEKNEKAWAGILGGDLQRVVRYHRINGDPAESVAVDILTHVCTHAMYHRGQIAAQANRLGLRPPATDFIVFSRLFPG